MHAPVRTDRQKKGDLPSNDEANRGDASRTHVAS
jgi:hypothetical protein